MQLGAPCHRFKVAKIFLEKHKIELLEWPGNSSDLNLIENVMTNIKNNVSEKYPSRFTGFSKGDKKSSDKRNFQRILPKSDR